MNHQNLRVKVLHQSSILDIYARQYQPNLSTVLTLTREGNKLMMQQGLSAEKRELLAETEVNFFTVENPA